MSTWVEIKSVSRCTLIRLCGLISCLYCRVTIACEHADDAFAAKSYNIAHLRNCTRIYTTIVVNCSPAQEVSLVGKRYVGDVPRLLVVIHA